MPAVRGCGPVRVSRQFDESLSSFALMSKLYAVFSKYVRELPSSTTFRPQGTLNRRRFPRERMTAMIHREIASFSSSADGANDPVWKHVRVGVHNRLRAGMGASAGDDVCRSPACAGGIHHVQGDIVAVDTNAERDRGGRRRCRGLRVLLLPVRLRRPHSIVCC